VNPTGKGGGDGKWVLEPSTRFGVLSLSRKSLDEVIVEMVFVCAIAGPAPVVVLGQDCDSARGFVSPVRVDSSAYPPVE